jgi:hypothetical protein
MSDVGESGPVSTERLQLEFAWVGLRIIANGMSPYRRYPVRYTNQDLPNVSTNTTAVTWPFLSFVIILSQTKLSGFSWIILEKLAVVQLDNRIPRISWSPEICYSVLKTLPLDRILSHMNLLYTCPPNFCKINFKMKLDSVDTINDYGLEDSEF